MRHASALLLLTLVGASLADALLGAQDAAASPVLEGRVLLAEGEAAPRPVAGGSLLLRVADPALREARVAIAEGSFALPLREPAASVTALEVVLDAGWAAIPGGRAALDPAEPVLVVYAVEPTLVVVRDEVTGAPLPGASFEWLDPQLDVPLHARVPGATVAVRTGDVEGQLVPVDPERGEYLAEVPGYATMPFRVDPLVGGVVEVRTGPAGAVRIDLSVWSGEAPPLLRVRDAECGVLREVPFGSRIVADLPIGPCLVAGEGRRRENPWVYGEAEVEVAPGGVVDVGLRDLESPWLEPVRFAGELTVDGEVGPWPGDEFVRFDHQELAMEEDPRTLVLDALEWEAHSARHRAEVQPVVVADDADASRFTFDMGEIPPGPYCARFGDRWASIEVPARGDSAARVELPPLVEVPVEVVDAPHGAPVEAEVVSGPAVDTFGGRPFSVSIRALAAAQGRTTLRLPVGERVAIFASPTGFGLEPASDLVEVTEPAEVARLELRPLPCAVIECRLPAGAPPRRFAPLEVSVVDGPAGSRVVGRGMSYRAGEPLTLELQLTDWGAHRLRAEIASFEPFEIDVEVAYPPARLEVALRKKDGP